MAHSVTPVAYRLTIEPDLDRFTFAGRMTLDANADEPTDTITLDCAELAIWGCRIKPKGPMISPKNARLRWIRPKTRLTIHLPGRLSGPIQLTSTMPAKSTTAWPASTAAGSRRTRRRHISPSPSFRKAMPGVPFPAWIIPRKRRSLR
jgi:aminopeptidase N